MSDFETNEENESDHTNKEKEDEKIAFKRLKNHININHIYGLMLEKKPFIKVLR